MAATIRAPASPHGANESQSDPERPIAQIREAMQKKRSVLGGLVSICAWCEKVLDEGVWLPLETYVSSHLKIKFSHGICEDCLRTVEIASHKPPQAERSAEGGSSIQKRLQKTRYMVVGHVKDAAAVCRRFWDRGRILPSGLVLVSAWFDESVERSYHLMQTHDRRSLDEWMANWNDLIEFEVYPVITPEEASEKVVARMRSSTSRRSAGPSGVSASARS